MKRHIILIAVLIGVCIIFRIHPNAAGAKVIASMISAKLIEICRMK